MVHLTSKEVRAQLEQLSPVAYACDWDNVGLLVGHEEQQVNRVLVALDASVGAVDMAVNEGVDLLVTHHPMLFQSIKRVTSQDAVGAKILALVEAHIGYYAMHTNFDIMGSMAELAADRLDLLETQPLEVTAESARGAEGIGRVGIRRQDATLGELAQQVKQAFALERVMVYGDVERSIHKIALSPGAGKSMIKEALANHCDVLISGDLGHHEGMDAVEAGLCIIDATHYGLEYIFVDFVAQYLRTQCSGVEVIAYHEPSPCQFI
jgi:dinuclear metal center YbgI/SA1388 family protein